jgi:hypothetical protein
MDKMEDDSSDDSDYNESFSSEEDWDSEDEEEDESDSEDESELPEEDVPVVDRSGRQIRKPRPPTQQELHTMSNSDLQRVADQMQTYTIAHRQQRQAELNALLRRYAAEDKS